MDSKSANRPWSSERRQMVPERLAGSIAMTLGVNEKTTYIRCVAARDAEAVALGVAKLLPSPVRCFRIDSENLSAGEAGQVANSLHAGNSVVALFVGPSELARELNDQWADCSSYPDGSTYVFRNFVLRGVDKPGFLATVHVVESRDFISHHGAIFRATPEEVATLELLGTPSLTAITRLGTR